MPNFTEMMQELSDVQRDESDILTETGGIVGMDEAGRGALAGPMHVGACLVRQPDLAEEWTDEIDDSKALTVKTRQKLARRIKKSAEAWGVAACEPWTIDEFGLPSCLNACVRLLSDLLCSGELVAFDGSEHPEGVEGEAINVVGGDSRFVSIGAASILAKTTRDAYMSQMSFEYPAYGFENNVGYGTGDHRIALRKHGASPTHRLSFRPVSSAEETWDGDRVEASRQTIDGDKLSEEPRILLVSGNTG